MKRYNIDKYLIYSSITNCFVNVSEDVYQKINLARKNGDINITLFSKKTFQYLKEAKIIVAPTEDDAFVRQCEIDTYISNYASSHMSLSLAPTSSCNFVCPYCYEKSKPNNTMSDSTIDSLIKFINGHEQVKTVGITWYGGEPLVAFETIKKIVQRIDSDCRAKLISQDIVTNGYNFNDNVIEFFKGHPLKRIQITIDGPEEEHNKLRKLANGKGTYNRIISNISSIIQGLPDTQIAIRVNISKDNQDGYPILCKELQERFSNKISVYPGFIRIHDENQTHLVCDSMEQKDAISFYEKLEDEGSINIDYYPNLCQKRGCVATCSTAYVVGPLGELYKCWNDMGNEEMIVGNIANEELIRPDLYNQYMVEGQWLSDDDCKKCFFLPICSGGCAWQRVRNKFHGGLYNFCCIYKEGGIEKFLKLYYKKKYSPRIKIHKDSMNARLLFSLIFFHLCAVVFSQTFSIKGTVISSDTQTPLEFVNVTLADMDGKILQGTITDSLGRFNLIVNSHIQPLEKSLIVSYLGYESIRMSSVDKENIGTISMTPSVKKLQEVVVAGRKSPFTMKGGTFTANIQKSILKDAGNAMGVLKQLPLVNIKNDIVNIFGKGEALIYIDNKELHSNEDLLKLSSNKIKKVDIITTPGVQYSASVGAVIKITTTTPDEGFSGLINTKVQRGEDWSEILLTNISYAERGFSLFADYSMQDLRKKQNQQTDVEINDLTHNLIQSNNILNLSRRTHNLGIAAEYKASENHLLGIKYNHSFLSDGHYGISGATTAYIESKKDAEYSQVSHYKPSGDGGNMNMFYKGKFSKWSVDINADYTYGQTKTLAYYDNTEHIKSVRNIVNSNSKNDYRLWATRLELSRVIGNSSVLFGADYAKTRNNSYYNNDDMDLQNDLPETYTSNKQELFSLFLNYKCNQYDFDIEMGLRYEFVNQHYYINGMKIDNQSKTYSNVFPTIIISRPFFNDKMNMALSYRRVVNRPSYYQLRGDVQYNSPYSYEAGNPLLQNTYIDDINYTVSYLNLNFIASYKSYHDKILFTIDQFEDKAITISRFTNVDGFKKLSIASVWDPTFFKIWNPEIEVGFEKQFFKLNNGYAVNSYNRPYLYVSLYNIIKFPHTLSFVTQAKCWTSYNSGVSCEHSGMFVDAYIQKYFFDKTMAVKIGAENIFNTNKDKWDMAFNTVTYKKNANNDSRFIYMSFIYNFHNAKKYAGKGTRNSERNRLNTL